VTGDLLAAVVSALKAVWCPLGQQGTDADAGRAVGAYPCRSPAVLW